MSRPSNAGNPTVIITDEEIATWNLRFAAVFYPQHRIALVHDALTGEKHRFVQFVKKFGAKADRWLQSPARLTYMSELGWLSARAVAAPLDDEARAIAPTAERAR